MITVTFTAVTLYDGSMRSVGSTLSVSDSDARVLVDIGVATAPGLTPQGGWPTGQLSDTFVSKVFLPFGTSNGLTQRLDFITSSSVSGSGAVTTSFLGFREAFTSSTGTVGRASINGGSIGVLGYVSGLTSEAQVNFSKKIWMSGRFMANLNATYVGDANGFVSISLGGYTTNTTGAMTVKGIGLRKVGGASSVIQLVVHNGTTQTLVDTTKTMGTLEVVEYLIYSDGAGNVQLYLNGSLAASSSAGPTGNTANFQGVYREQAEQTASATARHLIHCYGGQIIIEV